MTSTIAQMLVWAEAELAAVDSPKLDAELLLAKALEQSRTYLFTWPERSLTAAQLTQFKNWVAQRKQGTPVAYLLEEQGFWSLNLTVTPATLIPRPETELLVELVLSLVQDNNNNLPHNAQVLDLGTGSGAIALALAKEQPQWHVTAVDNSPDALAVAKQNARQNKINSVNFLHSDWFSRIESSRRFDLIVSNPPYIAEGDYHLSDGDVRFEPSAALVAKADGLADIQIIAEHAKTFLNPGGWLLFEHGYNQGPAAVNLLAQLGYQQVCCHKDFGGRNRVCQGQWL